MLRQSYKHLLYLVHLLHCTTQREGASLVCGSEIQAGTHHLQIIKVKINKGIRRQVENISKTGLNCTKVGVCDLLTHFHRRLSRVECELFLREVIMINRG